MLLNKFHATPCTCVAFTGFVCGTKGDGEAVPSLFMMGVTIGASADDTTRDCALLRLGGRGLTGEEGATDEYTTSPETACCQGLPPCTTSCGCTYLRRTSQKYTAGSN